MSVIRCGTRKAEPIIVGNSVIVYRYVVHNGCGVVNATPGKCWNCEREIVSEKPTRSIRELQNAIDEHYESAPDHGPGCACMDGVRREFRRLLNSEQMRTDIGKATFWLMVNDAIKWR